MAGRLVKFGLGGAALAGGYYLYQAGGDPKAAQQHAEADISKASHKVKGDVSDGEKEAEKRSQAYLSQAGQKIDQTADDARAKFREAESKASSYGNDAQKRFEQTRKDTGEKLMSGVDKFDQTVEKKAAETKGGISSWFGFGGSSNEKK
ncbi:MAG: hypothetical protein Q9227_005707 [Pyrenula ochraceoflavens]